jgi:hypothetical protein
MAGIRGRLLRRPARWATPLLAMMQHIQPASHTYRAKKERYVCCPYSVPTGLKKGGRGVFYQYVVPTGLDCADSTRYWVWRANKSQRREDTKIHAGFAGRRPPWGTFVSSCLCGRNSISEPHPNPGKPFLNPFARQESNPVTTHQIQPVGVGFLRECSYI